MCREVRNRFSDVAHQEIRQITAYALAHQNALDHRCLAICGQGVGRNLPAIDAQTICEVKKVKPGVHAVFQGPTQGRDAFGGVAIKLDIEKPK